MKTDGSQCLATFSTHDYQGLTPRMNGRGQKTPMARQMGTMWYTAWIPNISGARPPHEMPFAMAGCR